MIPKARFVLRKNLALEQYQKIRKICDIVSYSTKTNPEVANVLEQFTDCFFSVHTISELKHISDLSRVFFITQATTGEELDWLFSKGVYCFIIDNQNQLEVILKSIKAHPPQKKLWLMLRMKLKEHSVFTGRHFVFGMSSKTVNEEIKRISKDSEAMKHIEKLGIHFHRSTQNISEWSLKYEIEASLEPETLSLIQLLNMGGGFPVQYKNSSDLAIESIFSKVVEFHEWLNKSGIQLISEPGRYIAAPAVELFAYITCVEGSNVILNCSLYNSAMDTIIVPLKLIIKNELSDESNCQVYTIKGCTPCSLDIFRYSAKLKDPKSGDCMIFINAGAYNFSTDFCSLEKLETVIEEQ